MEKNVDIIAGKKQIIIKGKTKNLSNEDLQTLANYHALFPDFEMIEKREATEKQSLKKADIIKYVKEHGTPEQIDFYKNENKENTFFALKKQFYIDFPEYK